MVILMMNFALPTAVAPTTTSKPNGPRRTNVSTRHTSIGMYEIIITCTSELSIVLTVPVESFTILTFVFSTTSSTNVLSAVCAVMCASVCEFL